MKGHICFFLSDDIQPCEEEEADVELDDNDFEFVNAAEVDDSGNG